MALTAKQKAALAKKKVEQAQAWKGFAASQGRTLASYRAPATSAQPAAPAPAPMAPPEPPDWQQQQAQITAQRNIGIGDSQAAWQQGNLDQDYGFGAGGASNPYAKASLLQENYRRSTLGTENSYAAQGNMNSGAYGRAQDETTRNYDIGYDQLRRGYDQQTTGLQFDRLRNYANAGTGVDDATFQALLRKLGGV